MCWEAERCGVGQVTRATFVRGWGWGARLLGGVVGGSGGGWGGGVAAGQAHNNNLPSQPQPPRIKKAHFHPGACLMHARRYETVLAVCPGCAEAHNNLGVLHREAGNMERAAACYQGALAARPGFPQVGGWGWMQLCPCCCRPCCCRRCSWGPAATAAAAPDAHSAFWQSHCEALRKPSAFHPCFLRALSLPAPPAQALNNLAVVYTQQGRAQEALDMLKVGRKRGREREQEQ